MAFSPRASFEVFLDEVDDGAGGLDEALFLRVTEIAPNQPPIARNIQQSLLESDAPVVRLGFSIDPTDDFAVLDLINGDDAFQSGEPFVLPSGAALRFDPETENLFYDPMGAFGDLAFRELATDSFTYTVADGFGGTAQATVFLTIVGEDPTRGSDSADVFDGQNIADVFNGRAGRDTLNGNGGADTLSGGTGTDMVLGGGGRDILSGDGGADTLNGGQGADLLRGGAGRDSLSGDGGRDSLEGGGGRDVLFGGRGRDVIEGGGGKDILEGDNGGDVLEGGREADVLTGGFGRDVFVFAQIRLSDVSHHSSGTEKAAEPGDTISMLLRNRVIGEIHCVDESPQMRGALRLKRRLRHRMDHNPRKQALQIHRPEGLFAISQMDRSGGQSACA